MSPRPQAFSTAKRNGIEGLPDLAAAAVKEEKNELYAVKEKESGGDSEAEIFSAAESHPIETGSFPRKEGERRKKKKTRRIELFVENLDFRVSVLFELLCPVRVLSRPEIAEFPRESRSTVRC